VLWNRTESLLASNIAPSVLSVASAKEISTAEQHMHYYAIKASRSYTDMLCVCMSRSRMDVAIIARQNGAVMRVADCVSDRVAQVLRHADELKCRQQQS
jgi:hypothetical protein